MTGSAPPSVDELEALWRPAAVDEVCALMETLHPSDLTACELLGMVAMLRTARALRCSGGATRAVLQFIPGGTRKHPAASNQLVGFEIRPRVAFETRPPRPVAALRWRAELSVV
jgi:hypothetical protein